MELQRSCMPVKHVSVSRPLHVNKVCQDVQLGMVHNSASLCFIGQRLPTGGPQQAGIMWWSPASRHYVGHVLMMLSTRDRSK